MLGGYVAEKFVVGESITCTAYIIKNLASEDTVGPFGVVLCI